MPNEGLKSRITKQWQKIGFQATNFNGLLIGLTELIIILNALKIEMVERFRNCQLSN